MFCDIPYVTFFKSNGKTSLGDQQLNSDWRSFCVFGRFYLNNCKCNALISVLRRLT